MIHISFSEKTMKNKKVLARNALKEIREMFKASGITEAEFQASGRKIRWELTKQRYFSPEQKTPSSALLPSREKEGLCKCFATIQISELLNN